MSSIGPQLPPQPSKRKRTPEDDDDNPPPPASKNPRNDDARVNNEDEIGLDESDDDYGPSAPSAKAPLGPSLPPSNKDEIDLDESDDDGYGPVAPKAPETVAKPPVGPSMPPTAQSGPSPRPNIGPSLPDAESSSDSEDDYGPALPGASNAARRPLGPSLPPAEAAPQRDSWMLAPPTATGYTERDPTRIRARKFTSNPTGKPAGGAGVSSIWTETPEEKLRRLQDSVLGRSGPADEAATSSTGQARSREEEERNRRIAANIESQRGKSLYAEHQQRKKATGEVVEEEDDPSKRGFDKEKDMALGGQIGTAQRRELLNKAANFGGRFQKGSFL